MRLPEGYIHQHTLFEKKTFNSQAISKRWRQNPAMILIMPKLDEEALHAELTGLPRPSRDLAKMALFHLSLLPPEFGRKQRFESVTDLLWDASGRYAHTPIGQEAELFAGHLQAQLAFYDRVLSAEEERELGLPATCSTEQNMLA